MALVHQRLRSDIPERETQGPGPAGSHDPQARCSPKRSAALAPWFLMVNPGGIHTHLGSTRELRVPHRNKQQYVGIAFDDAF